jgi:phosphoribosyl-AMP cyclohydrolase / phosphoribosyl-ATP pyrophosphohydrolase
VIGDWWSLGIGIWVLNTVLFHFFTFFQIFKFSNRNNMSNIDFLVYLQDLIEQRKKEMPENSYTTKLFTKGINKIAQKVGEEAVELVIEAKDDNRELFLNEAADLFYHTLVLLTAKGYRIEDVVEILKERHK